MHKIVAYSAKPMFNTKGLIEQKVMQVVRAKIEAGQRQYEQDCERIDNEAFTAKCDAADRIVGEIIK